MQAVERIKIKSAYNVAKLFGLANQHFIFHATWTISMKIHTFAALSITRDNTVYKRYLERIRK